MKKTIQAILGWMLLLTGGCSTRDTGEAVIETELIDAAGKVFLLQEMDTRTVRTVDSVVIGPDGRHTFRLAVAQTGFWLLGAPTGKVLVLMLSPGDHVKVSGSATGFPDHIELAAPEETMALQAFFAQTRLNERKVDSLEMLIADHQEDENFYEFTKSLEPVFRQISEDQRYLAIGFIDRHLSSIGSLVVLNYAFGLSPVLSPAEDSAIYRRVDSALSSRYPDNKHVRYHHDRMQRQGAPAENH